MGLLVEKQRLLESLEGVINLLQTLNLATPHTLQLQKHKIAKAAEGIPIRLGIRYEDAEIAFGKKYGEPFHTEFFIDLNYQPNTQSGDRGDLVDTGTISGINYAIFTRPKV